MELQTLLLPLVDLVLQDITVLLELQYKYLVHLRSIALEIFFQPQVEIVMQDITVLEKQQQVHLQF